MRINDRENYNKIRNSISMKNLCKIIEDKGYTITKLAINSKVSDSTIISYINGQKIPSLPTLISIADFLNVNIDYLLDRTDNSMRVDDLKIIDGTQDLNLLIKNIMELPLEKRQLVKAYVQGLTDNK
ncbi:XRE family transcriptional regulator [bacterium]|nr:XRE family transcriptional regulator [bacterium]